MKKLVLFFISAFTFLGIACAAPTNSSSSRFTKGNSNTKVLVAYYSDTGTTKAVAQKIANYLGADLLEIESENPYTSADLDWTNRNSRVFREHDAIFGTKSNGQATAQDFSNAASEVSTKVDASSVIDLSKYDTVFVGYPIWWGMAAWPVNGFVVQNDLSGKKVVPFATSMSSGLGQSDKVLRDVAGEKGNWNLGKRFGTRASDSEVRTWVDSLSL